MLIKNRERSNVTSKKKTIGKKTIQKNDERVRKP